MFNGSDSFAGHEQAYQFLLLKATPNLVFLSLSSYSPGKTSIRSVNQTIGNVLRRYLIPIAFGNFVNGATEPG